ncbi:hypothetical protein T12_10472 [Trichinella patagoniensis]|uniref:Uncharacterized protein n=1 Tax=Trichinella patagoniensis TaxID=990121 RepID=A0A0V0Z3H5_9BILA|nr:hypothetical protein T12_10472 [Trichinella patagoniensis]
MHFNCTLIRRISFVNNGWRELKETPSRNWKTLCQAIMFGVSEKRPSSISKFCIHQSHLTDYASKCWTKCEATNRHASIEVAVAVERAQFSFDVVFSAVVALRCEWVPPKTACSGMLLVNPFVYSIGGEAHYSGIVSGTKINHYKYEKNPVDNAAVSNEEEITSQ